ncbi:MAG: hypothetical protein RLP02_35580 [Coleofasciculus sp. C2-GNP5-27]
MNAPSQSLLYAMNPMRLSEQGEGASISKAALSREFPDHFSLLKIYSDSYNKTFDNIWHLSQEREE